MSDGVKQHDPPPDEQDQTEAHVRIEAAFKESIDESRKRAWQKPNQHPAAKEAAAFGRPSLPVHQGKTEDELADAPADGQQADKLRHGQQDT